MLIKYLNKYFSSWNIFYWSLKKCLLPISTATVVRETNSFIKIMQLISPNYPLENGVKQIKSAEEKLSQSFILCSIAKDKDPSIRVKMKMHQIFYFYFYHYLSYICWKDVIYLICLIFLKSLLHHVWTFCVKTPLT